MVRVKICGITDSTDAVLISGLKPDALGFVFYKNSPRCITPDKAKAIIKGLPRSIKTVGVFVNERESCVRSIARRLNLDMLQFHGDESAEFCGRFKGCRIIKAVRVKDKRSIKEIAEYPVWGLMFDAYRRNIYGGTGKRFDWRLVSGIKSGRKTVFLSGGLDAENVQAAIALAGPDWVDVSSSVETRPGRKDYRLVKKFIEAVRA